MTGTLIIIIIFAALLCLSVFALGFEIADNRNKKEMEDTFLGLCTSEEEKEHVKIKIKMIREVGKSTIQMLILTIAIAIFVLSINLWAYRNCAMESLKTGKFGCEEVVRTRTKGDQVKVDTTYNFYRIKPEKK